MKNGPNKAHKVGLLVAAAVLLLGTALFQNGLNRERAALGLTRLDPLENAPPMLAFTTVALGSFRGLIANALWIRAQDLQFEEKFFEMVQLSDWITKLQPHMAQVWVNQAWNMSYNISVKFSDPADRWRWVLRGIELLRDEGLKYNPDEPLIYRELAWDFQHKMGHYLDDAQAYYKTEWAHQMQALLGAGRPDFDALIAPQTDELRQRAQTLREKYKLDPAIMKKVDAEYGPLEWRLPEAHAIYWAAVGMEKSKKEADLLVLRRVIYQSLHQIVFQGRIVLQREDGSYLFGPDLSKIPAAYEAYDKMIAEEKDKPDSIQRAQRNFMREVVLLFYNYNRLREAERWMQVLRERYPDAIPPNETLDDYVLRRTAADITEITHNQARTMIDGLLRQHLFFRSIGEDDHADGLYLRAQAIWRYYMNRIGNQTTRIGLPPLTELRTALRDEMLNPENGILSPEQMARLRTADGLPATPVTNAPPTNPTRSP
jgi:hypothetical protein